MADVKLVILSAFTAGFVLILVSAIAIIYLRRRSPGGVRRGLFAGSIVTLVIILGLGTLAVLGWQQFFTEFHSDLLRQRHVDVLAAGHPDPAFPGPVLG